MNHLVKSLDSGAINTEDFEEKSNKGQADGYVGLDANSEILVSEIPTLPQSNITNLITDLASKETLLGFTPENVANKNIANGYAGLDSSALIPNSELRLDMVSTLLNVGVGKNILVNLTTGDRNTAFGNSSLENITTQSKNVAIGCQALQNTMATGTVAIGEMAGQDAGNTVDSIFIGRNSGNNWVSGNENIAIGSVSGLGPNTGSRNILIGLGLHPLELNQSDCMNLGDVIIADLSNSEVTIFEKLKIHNPQVAGGLGNPVISASSPDQKLNITGKLQVTGDVNIPDLQAKNITLSENLRLGQDTVLGSTAGEINFDTAKSTMNIRNTFTGSVLQVGQELYVFVKNTSGITLEEGDVVRTTGYDATDDAIEVEKGLANIIETADVLGMVTTTMTNNTTGLVTIFGRVNDLDTSGCSAGERIYLSPNVAGKFTRVKPLAVPIQIGYIGKVDSTKGFIQVNIRELPSSIRGIFSDTTQQTYSSNVSQPIKFNTNDIIEGITHDVITDNEIITFDSGGVYIISVEPQYTRLSGGPTDVLNMFIQKDTGSGFVNVVDSNIKVAIGNTSLEQVTSLTQTLKFNAGDKIRVMVQCEAGDFILEAFPGFGTGVNTVPATPSVIMTIQRLGD